MALNCQITRGDRAVSTGESRPQIVICIVDSKAQVLYKMRLGPGEKQYFSADDQPITKEEAARLSGASERSNQP